MKTRRANTDYRHYSVCLAPLATHACMCLHHETVFGACFAWPGLLLATASTHSSISWSIFIKHAHHTLLTNTNACSHATRGGAISSALLSPPSVSYLYLLLPHGIGIGMRPPTSATPLHKLTGASLSFPAI